MMALPVSGNHLRRVRDVDMKRDYAFIEFSDPRDADDARYSLNGRDVHGSRITVEIAKGVPRGPGGHRDREQLGRGPPGTGRCFNCGLDGHWARDCKAGDWKNKCYRCGERGHIEKNCQNSPKKLKRGSYSRSPSPRRGRSRSHSYSRGRSYSRSRSPVKRERSRSLERSEKRSRSPRGRSSPKRHSESPPPSKAMKRSPTPDDRSPVEARRSPSPENHDSPRGSSRSPRGRSRSPMDEAEDFNGSRGEENGYSRSPSPLPREEKSQSPVNDEETNGSPRGGSESA